MTRSKTGRAYLLAVLVAVIAYAQCHLVLAAPAADYFIYSLPGAPPEARRVRQYAGHLPIDESGDLNMYFWLVLGETRPANSTEKLVIWLNGGPGCSSLEGMVLENGPLLVSENGKLHANEHSWHKRANVLYIDQPIGTGYSFSKLRQKTTTQVQMAEQFTNFLVKFFAVFPNLQESDIYLAGESFAGTYIPYIAQAILVHNSFQPIVTANSSMIPWSLKGMMIGNGWIDPVNQYRSYIDFGVKHNLLSGGFLTTAEEDWVGCRSAMEKNGVRIHVPECESISNQVTEQSKVNHGGLCMNVYDIRLRDESFGDGCGAAWPSTLMGAYRFFGDQTLLDYTHAQGSVNQWVECSSSVFDAMKKDSSLPSITLLPDLVKKVPLFLYSGDQDFICNHQGTETMLDDLAWGGNDAAMPPMKQPVYVGDRKFGSFQRAGNITYVLVYNSSHMVPINEPSGMLALLDDMLGIAPVQLTPSLNEQSQAPNSNSTGAPISSAQPDRFGAGFGTGMLVTIVLVAVIGAIALYRRPVLRRIWRQRGPKLHRSADQIGMDPLTTMTQPDHEVLFSHDDHEDGDDEEAVLGRVSQLGYHSGSDSESEGRRPRMR